MPRWRVSWGSQYMVAEQVHAFAHKSSTIANRALTRRVAILTFQLGVVSLLLGACSTSIKYAPWTQDTVVQSSALKFSLQDSTVTLSLPAATSTADHGGTNHAGVRVAGAQPKNRRAPCTCLQDRGCTSKI